MTSKREGVLTAVVSVLTAALDGVKVERNDPIPATVPEGGRIIVHDGDPGEADIILGSPLLYEFQHEIPVDALVQKAAQHTRAADLDSLLAAMGAALAADRTLGGLVDYLDWSAPDTADARIQGAAAVKGASVTLVATYTTTNPLG